MAVLQPEAGEASATLVWTRISAKWPNNLDLFLYHAGTGELTACSTSLVDNVEHIYVPHLSAGFTVQTAPGLAIPLVWTSLTNLVLTVTNGQNRVVLPVGEGPQLYRLSRQ